MEKEIIYTIGHSSHPLEFFLGLLQTRGISCLVDIRTVPASAYNPQFNKEPFAAFLKRNGIAYLHLPEEFGARHTEPELLNSSGRVDFEKVRNTEKFRSGVKRIRQGLDRGFVIALMCSESDPFQCHRYSMVSIGLERAGLEIRHILKDDTLTDNRELEKRLLQTYEKKIPRPNLFEPNIDTAEQINAAYTLLNNDVGFSPSIPEEEELYD